MTIKKRNLKNNNKNTFYKKKKMMKGGLTKTLNENNNDKKDYSVVSHSGILGVLEKAASILSIGLTVVVNKVTKMLDIDVSELNEQSKDMKQIIIQKIDEINEALKDPETQEQLRELAKILAEKGGVMLEAASPSLKKSLFKLIEIVTEGGIKLGHSMIKLILDLAGAVPVVGEVVEAIRILDDIVKAIQSTIAFSLELYTTNVDAVTETIRRFNSLIKSKSIDSSLNSPNKPTETYNSDFNEKVNEEYDSNNDEIQKQVGGVSSLSIKKRIINSISKFHKTNKVKRQRNHKKQTKKRNKRKMYK
jgi:hypothetical protein